MVVGVASATNAPRSRPFARAYRAAVALVAFGAVLLVATPARASCPLLDLDCLTETVSGAADEVIDDTTEVVDGVVEGVTDATEPVTTTVEEVVESVVATVEETVDDVVAVVEETVEGAVGGGAPEEPRAGTDDEGAAERPDADPRPSATVPSGAGPDTLTPHAPAGPAPLAGDAPTALAGVTAVPPGGAPVPAASPASIEVDGATTQPAGSPTAVRDAGPSQLVEVARTLAFPLALAILIVLFLLAQHRIDRRTPKLALAPVEPDVVDFRRAAGR
jgi:hypothetical protein